MFLRSEKRRWLVAPLATLILLFSTGVAVAPECHLAFTTQVAGQTNLLHNHPGVLHDHSPQSNSSLLSASPEKSASVGGGLNEEICFVVGFVVLLLLRFSRFFRSISTSAHIPRPRFIRPLLLTRNLSHLNLTHLKLGIIRI